MSWTIEDSSLTPEGRSDALRALDTALTAAAQQNILMFCAARDEGLENPSKKPFPAATIASNIIVIGAASPSGASWTWVSRDSVHYLFPGSELQDFLPELIPADMSAVDGSSTATALASGLAGLLLSILSKDTSKAWPNSKEGRQKKTDNILQKAIKGSVPYAQIWIIFERFLPANKQSENDKTAFQKLVNSLLHDAN